MIDPIDPIDCNMVCGELMVLSALGGGGVGDLRGGGADADGRRSPGFGDTGRANGSGFDTFDGGGGGIIPLLLSTRVTTGREIDISPTSLLVGVGALRFMTFDVPAFCLSTDQKKKLSH